MTSTSTPASIAEREKEAASNPSDSHASNNPDLSSSTPPTEPLPASSLLYLPFPIPDEPLWLPQIRALIATDLSEPYSIYVYRYFLHQWADLSLMAVAPHAPHTLLGVIICKLEAHRSGTQRGYVAMLAVSRAHRRRGIAAALVRRAVAACRARGADEVVLETEVDNRASLRLYEGLGFVRAKRLHRYYLNGNAAFRLVLYLRPGAATRGLGRDAVAAAAADDDPLAAAGMSGPSAECEDAAMQRAGWDFGFDVEGVRRTVETMTTTSGAEEDHAGGTAGSALSILGPYDRREDIMDRARAEDFA